MIQENGRLCGKEKLTLQSGSARHARQNLKGRGVQAEFRLVEGDQERQLVLRL